MKLDMLRGDLVKELGKVGRVAASHSATLPILANVLLEATETGLRVGATNLDIGVSTVVAASVGEAGKLTVPARLFGDIVKSLPDDDIEIAAQDGTLHIRSGGYAANLKGLSAEDFPMQTFEQIRPVAHVSGAPLKEAIIGVAPAAAIEESRPMLTGIHCVFDAGTLQLSATDGYRLMRATIAAECFGQRTEILIPSKSLIEVARIVRPDDTVEVGVANDQYVFRTGGTVFYCAALGGEFPNVDAIVPSAGATTAVVDTEALTQATRVAHLFAKDSADILRLSLTETELRVEATGLETGDNVNTVDAMVSGDPLSIGVNAKYLLDALNGVDTPQTTLGFNASNQPVMVRPSGGDTKFFAVIMPMTLRG